ncbi:MAG TPA: hypothetical protein VK213_08130 [Bacteroidales bacterium]|nr:hypothetical protein [Bacteroidales bacterium]
MKRTSLLTIIILLFCFKSVKGQYYNTGQDPASVRWLRIKTERFTLIYPKDYGQAGIDLARSLDMAQKRMPLVFPGKRMNLPIVVHSLSAESNGYVAWAPKRMELYPLKEQNAIPGDQNLLLSLHEFTHAYQMQSLNKGFTRAMSLLVGQQMPGAVSSLLPLWFLEGDAVVTESVLSNTGRGRFASFQKPVKALTLSKDPYGYDKMLNGSFRDYVPDHYQYGYQLVSWSLSKYNKELWNNVLDFTGRQPFTIIPVNIILSRETGLTKRKLYYETIDSLKVLWEKDTAGKEQYTALSPVKKKEFINYFSPVFAGSDSIIAVKTSLSSSPSIVLVNPSSKNEKTLFHPGFMYPYRLDYGGGMIVWAENRPDPRWENRSYSVVIVYDIKKGSAKRIGYKSRYMAAGISPDGSTVCAVEAEQDNSCNLVFIDADRGEIINSVAAPPGTYLQRPKWSEDGKWVTVIYLTDEGEGIMSYSVHEKRWQVNMEPEVVDLQAGFLKKDTLLFVSSRYGTDNLFMKTAGETLQVTNSEFGITDPDISGNNIIFSDYKASGNLIGSVTFQNAGAIKTDRSFFLIDRLDSAYKDLPLKFIPEETTSYSPEPFRKWQHLFRFHSWLPFYADIDKVQSDPLSVRPGFTLMSQNTLSTLETTLGYEYSENGEHLFHSKVLWAGLYPVIEAKVGYGYNRRFPARQFYDSNGKRYSGVISIPLRYSTGWFSQYVRPSLTLEYLNSIYQVGDRKDMGQTELTWGFYFSNYSRSALRDIYPLWAQSIDLNYITYPFDKDLFGTTFIFRSSFYFPGIFRDNGIRIRYSSENQDQDHFIFTNSISHPRGYEDVISKQLNTASFDYVFPVAYPDFNISSLLYIKRIRSGLFYDYAAGKGNRHYQNNGSGQVAQVPGTEIFRSYGVELLSDFHIFRIPFMISGGIQAAWTDKSEMPVFKVLFNIDLYGFNLGK